MKNASTPPSFRLWTPTGELFPAVGASAVGFGKTMTDIESKWYNKDAWKVDSFLKRNKDSQIWMDPSASKDGKKAAISGTFGYDDMDRKIKYRGTTDDSMKHTSEMSYTMPLQDGEQRVKVSVATTLDKATFMPNTANVETKVFWKAMLPKFTTEAMVKQTPSGVDSLNWWIQGEVNNNLAYGGMAEFALASNTLKNWEAGFLNTLKVGDGVLATRAVTRNGDDIEVGVMPPAKKVGDKKVSLYAKAKHSVSKGSTDVSLASEVNICPTFDLKAKFGLAGLSNLTTAVAAVFSYPNNWRVAASVMNPGCPNQQFGVRFSQGSTPAPL